jgi:hypothetical protein
MEQEQKCTGRVQIVKLIFFEDVEMFPEMMKFDVSRKLNRTYTDPHG